MDIKVGNAKIKESDLTFVGKGGEKKIFRRGNIAFAIYHDPNKMIPVGKIQELSILDRPEIVRPLELIHNTSGGIVGYTMAFLEDATWFSKLFGSNFCRNHKIDDKKKLDIVRTFRELVEYVHRHDCFIVDVNELNFMLYPNDIRSIYAIDTTTYKTPSYPATAIVPLIQDPHASEFNANTDWYSWGMLVCQLLVGTNPYRGNHPDFDGVPKDLRIVERKRQNVSIFNPKTVIPSACNPLDILPKGLRDWMYRVYEKGERLSPPVNFEDLAKLVVQIPANIVVNGFSLIELGTFKNDIIAVYPAPSKSAVVLSTGEVRWGKESLHVPSVNCKILWDKVTADIYVFYIKDDQLHYMQKDGVEHSLNFNTKNVLESNGRIIAIGENHICEVDLVKIGKSTKVFLNPVGSALQNPDAVIAVDGMILENHLGSWVYQIYKEKAGCFYGQLEEIKDKRVVEAVAQKNVAVLKVFDNGSYDRYIFRFDDKGHDFIVDKNVPVGPSSLAVNDSGVACCLTESDELITFSSRKNSPSIQRMSNTAIDSSYMVTATHNMIVTYKKNRVWRLTKAT